MDSQDPAALEAEADRAAARGDLAAARALLERTVALDRSRADSWLKLSAICRGLGDLQAALVGVSGALAVEPLGFVPLLLKASILEKLGREAEAGEAYGHALAQQPQSVASHLRQMTEHAKRMHAAHVERMAARLDGALDAAAAKLDGCERRRAERFRDNIVRRTRPFHSEPTHFHYPGLREREFHDREDFPWLAELEAATDPILADFNRVLTAERAELEPYIQYPESAPLRQWAALNRNRDWTAIHLVRGGVPVEANARHCPTTMALLEHLEQPVIPGRGPNAMFSLLAPGAHIPPHNGVSNARLVCHLPLIVPPRCWFRVGAETREWKVGEAWVFDDTIEHEAMNGSDALRVLLIIDTWHPDLSPGERGAVSAMIAASGFDDGPEAL